MRRAAIFIISVCMCLLSAPAAWTAEFPRSETGPAARPPAPGEAMSPIVVGTPETAAPGKAVPPSRTADRPAEPRPEIRVDAAAHAVRFPVVLGRPQGVVEWLLTSDRKHPGQTVFTTGCAAADLAKAFAKAGFPAGRPPVRLGEDRVRPPTGPGVEITVIVKGQDGKETRRAATAWLSAKSGGEPLAQGQWVWVGPQVIRDGDAEILVPGLSGSFATTNLGDASAFVYWAGAGDDAESSGKTFYVSVTPKPAAEAALEVEVRLLPPKDAAAAPKPPERPAPAGKTPE